MKWHSNGSNFEIGDIGNEKKELNRMNDQGEKEQEASQQISLLPVLHLYNLQKRKEVM